MKDNTIIGRWWNRIMDKFGHKREQAKQEPQAESKPVSKTNGGPNFTPPSPSPATIIQRRQRMARRIQRRAAA